MMKFKQKSFLDNDRYTKVRRYIIIAVVATMVPAVFMTYNIVRESIFKTNISKFVNDRLENTGTRIISYDVNSDSLTLRVVAVGRELSENTIKNAEQSMADYKLGRYRLQVIQGSESDSVMLLNNKLANMRTSTDNYAAMFHEEAQKTARLQELLNEYTRYEAMAPVIAKETKALFPKTRNISLALANEASADTTVLKRYAVAIIGIEQQTRLTDDEQKRMSEWLGTRLGVDTVHIFIRH